MMIQKTALTLFCVSPSFPFHLRTTVNYFERGQGGRLGHPLGCRRLLVLYLFAFIMIRRWEHKRDATDDGDEDDDANNDVVVVVVFLEGQWRAESASECGPNFREADAGRAKVIKFNSSRTIQLTVSV